LQAPYDNNILVMCNIVIVKRARIIYNLRYEKYFIPCFIIIANRYRTNIMIFLFSDLNYTIF